MPRGSEYEARYRPVGPHERFHPGDQYHDPKAVAESPEQYMAIRDVASALEDLVERRGWTHLWVGSHCFFAWLPDHPEVTVAPDVFVIEEPPERVDEFLSFQTWRHGHVPPRWALEVVSRRWKKDYADAPRKYGELGCAELVVFDPAAATGRTRIRVRVPLSVYRRNAESGVFEQVYSGPGPVHCEQLDCDLRVDMLGRTAQLQVCDAGAQMTWIPPARIQLKRERKRADAEAQRADVQAKLADAFRKRIEALEKRVEAFETTARALEKTAGALEELLRAERSRADALERVAETERSRADAFERRANDLARASETELAQLRRDLQDLQRQVREPKRRPPT